VRTLRQGTIVYAVVLDKQGKNPKRRPVILLTPPDKVPEGQPLIGVAVSTQPKDPLPDECVRLPSNRQKQGSSRLPERCAAVCNWAVQFYPEHIEEVGGMVYGELLYEIVEKVKPYVVAAQPPPPKDEATDSSPT
jgi:hypothetical protein